MVKTLGQRIKVGNKTFGIVGVLKRVYKVREIFDGDTISTVVKSIPITNTKEQKKHEVINNKTKKIMRLPGINFKGLKILKTKINTYLVVKNKKILTELVTQRSAKSFINKL